MLNFIGHTLERILFAINFILAVQVPGFIGQYTQRLAGHLDEAKYQLGNYQVIADQHYQGDLLLLIKRYQSNSDAGIRASGNVVLDLVERITNLSDQVAHLLTSDYLTMIYYFSADIELPIARATLRDYQLSMPLEMNAIVTGLVFAVFASIIVHFVGGLWRSNA